MYKPADLKQAIEQGLPGAIVEVQDLTGGGDHFQATVVCDQFAGKSLLEQHQMVYKALEVVIKGDLHAIGLKTYTPDRWKKVIPLA